MLQKIAIQDLLIPVQFMSADDFCTHWVPIVYGSRKSNAEYISNSIELLSIFLNKSKNTTQKWLGSASNTPKQVGQTLWLLHTLLKIKMSLL